MTPVAECCKGEARSLLLVIGLLATSKPQCTSCSAYRARLVLSLRLGTSNCDHPQFKHESKTACITLMAVNSNNECCGCEPKT